MPSVAVCDQHWNNSAQCPQDMITLFPWYLAENYYGLWRRYHQQLHDFFQGLPEELAARIITVQVSQGSTGDLCPREPLTISLPSGLHSSQDQRVVVDRARQPRGPRVHHSVRA